METTAAIGDWIMPWPGETVMAEVVELSASGQDFVCRTAGGQIFSVSRDCLLSDEQLIPRKTVRELLTDPQCGSNVPSRGRTIEGRLRNHLRLIKGGA